MEMEQGVQRWLFNSTSWKPLASEFSFCLSLLPHSEQCDVMRFIKLEDQKRALISRLMQRMLIHILLNIPYSEVLISRTKEGKPYLANSLKKSIFPNLNFNISHHGDYVGMASEPICLVGLDIGVHDGQCYESPQKYLESFCACFTDLEWKNINSAGPEAGPLFHQFIRYWCMKEAYIKAIGMGLGFELQRAEFYFKDGDIWSDVAYLRLDGKEKDDWEFYLLRIGNDHWACVAKGPPAAAVESFKETLDKVDLNGTTFMSALKMTNKLFRELSIEDLIPGSKVEEFRTCRENFQDDTLEVCIY